MEIKVFNNFEELSFKAAEEFYKTIEENKERKIVPILLAGGMTILGMEKILADFYQEKINWQKIHLFWGDEHIVPKNHPKNNFKMAFWALKPLAKIIPAQNIHPIFTEDKEGSFNFSKAKEEAKRYSLKVKEALRAGEENFLWFF